MAKKASKVDARVALLVDEIREQGLSAQIGGFEVETIPTGISTFDISTGVGGIPLKRLTLLQGWEGSGKTLMLLSLIANTQRAGRLAAFVDAEHSLTPGFARLLGVNYDELLISRPTTLNEAYDIIKILVKSGEFAVVGFDSANSLTTMEDLELSAMAGTTRAAEAQVHSSELKKLFALCHKDTAMVFINQLRKDVNPPPGYKGPPRSYAPGGVALRFAASLRVDVKLKEPFRRGNGQIYGYKIGTHILKNKVAPPFKKAEFSLTFEGGIDTVVDLIEACILAGIIQRRGSNYYFNVVDEDGEILEEDVKSIGRAKLDELIKSDEDYQKTLNVQLQGGEGGIEEDDEAPNGWDAVKD